jgi:hypothetical protein
MIDNSKKAACVSASDWDCSTINELGAALESRRISASELLEHTIARIDSLDGRLTAVVVRDFERAREAARAADTGLGKGERRPLLGRSRSHLKNRSMLLACRRLEASRSSRILYRKRMRSSYPA